MQCMHPLLLIPLFLVGRLLRLAFRLETNQRPSIPNSHSSHQKMIPITPEVARVNAALAVQASSRDATTWSAKRRKFEKGFPKSPVSRFNYPLSRYWVRFFSIPVEIMGANCRRQLPS
jgi:hypothetical protein